MLIYSIITVIKTKGIYGSDGKYESGIWEIRTNVEKLGKPRCRWEDIIKVNRTETE